MIEGMVSGVIKYGGGLLIALWFILITLAATKVLLGWP